MIHAGTARAYDLAARKYHDLFHNEMHQKEYDRKLLDAFSAHFSKGSLLCDAGCGPSGHIGRYVSDKGINVIGVDISERCVELARRNNPGMRFECCDMATLPFDAESLDGVISYYSIIHTPKSYTGVFFREFHRVLKRGGTLLVAVKAGVTEGYLTTLLDIKTEVYFSLFDEKEIASFFETGGFRLEFMERRNPYGFEIDNERIFAVGRKLS